MKKINPQNYEYLWSNFNPTFFFISYWLNKEYKKRDTLIIFDSKAKEAKFFLSKKDKKSLGKFGLLFFSKLFPSWKEKIFLVLKEAKRFIKKSKKKNLSSLSNQSLKKEFLSVIGLYHRLGELYFFTEFFLQEEIEKKLRKSPKKYKRISLNLKEMQKIKLKARETINQFWFKEGVFLDYINEIKKRTKRKDLYWLSFEEIVKLLEGKKIKKSERNKKDWILTKFNNWKPIIGKRASRILREFNYYFFEKRTKEIKGQIANPGIYKGEAKILPTIFSKEVKKEIAKMKTGDILVASTTGPEIMVACKKAGAIITDEGGITCHAAIVSRELKIPCIIGTKIATKVLKDGDLVEVDANKGVIKILKKSK